MKIANDYFMNKFSDPSKNLVQPPDERIWKSNIWTWGTYATGLMSLYNSTNDSRYLDYLVDWGEKHNWTLSSAEMWNDQLAGQTYIYLYKLNTTKHESILDVKTSIDTFIAVRDTKGRVFGADWNWVDASYMGMPVFAKLGALTGDDSYFEPMHALFMNMKDTVGGRLFNEEDDVTFVVILWGGISSNHIWTTILSLKNKSYDDFVNKSIPIIKNILFSALAGTIWYLQFFFYGMGESKLGNAASSLILHMSTMILTANMWGIYCKEWSCHKNHLDDICWNYGDYISCCPCWDW